MRHLLAFPYEIILSIFEYIGSYSLKKYKYVCNYFYNCSSYIIRTRTKTLINYVHSFLHVKPVFIKKMYIMNTDNIFIVHILDDILKDKKATNMTYFSLSLISLINSHFIKRITFT
jgi:choline kinase